MVLLLGAEPLCRVIRNARPQIAGIAITRIAPTLVQLESGDRFLAQASCGSHRVEAQHVAGDLAPNYGKRIKEQIVRAGDLYPTVAETLPSSAAFSQTNPTEVYSTDSQHFSARRLRGLRAWRERCSERASTTHGPPHSGSVFKQNTDELGLTVAPGGRGPGVARFHPEFIVRLEKAMASSAEAWLARLAAYDLAQICGGESQIDVRLLPPQPTWGP